jgi:undecaprenyl-diphosphatase
MVPYFPDFIQNIDVAVLNWIHEVFSCAFLDVVMPIITALGNKGLFMIAVAAVMVCFKKTRKAGIAMGIALILGLVLGNGLLKNLFGRVRPYELEGALVTDLLIKTPHDYSFPSGHTLASFEFASVMAICYKSLPGKKLTAAIAVILGALIAFSRLYLYVHFPSDVLGGAILGTLFGIIGVWVGNAVSKKIKK